MTSPLTALLLAQRANGTTLADLPADLVPQSAAEAYAIQDELIAALGPVGAWKVQPIPAGGGWPMCSPILARDVHQSDVQLQSAGLPGLAIEVEVAVTIGSDLPGKPGGYAPQDMKAAVRSLHVALEVLASRYRERTGVPMLAGIADLQSSGAVVVGPAVLPGEWPEFGQQRMALSFDGVEVQTTPGNSTTENLLAALAWLADHCASRGLPLKAGDLVITGSRIGPKAFAKGSVTADAPGLGIVSARFV